MKTCSVCLTPKEESDFEKYYNKQLNSTFLRTKCKDCINEERRARYSKRRVQRELDLSITNFCMVQMRTRFKKLAAESGIVKDYSFMTVDWFNERLKEQNGCCALCDKSTEELGRRLVIDHDHTTGEFRGLLCTNCNTALGVFGDDVKGVSKVLDYLTK